MSLVDDFRNDFPLTQKKLVEWIETALAESEKHAISHSAMTSIRSANKGANITSILSVSQFDGIHDAIKDGTRVCIAGEALNITPIFVKVFDVESDGFYSFELSYFDESNTYVNVVISKMQNAVYLDNKKSLQLIS